METSYSPARRETCGERGGHIKINGRTSYTIILVMMEGKPIPIQGSLIHFSLVYTKASDNQTFLIKVKAA